MILNAEQGANFASTIPAYLRSPDFAGLVVSAKIEDETAYPTTSHAFFRGEEIVDDVHLLPTIGRVAAASDWVRESATTERLSVECPDVPLFVEFRTDLIARRDGWRRLLTITVTTEPRVAEEMEAIR